MNFLSIVTNKVGENGHINAQKRLGTRLKELSVKRTMVEQNNNMIPEFITPDFNEVEELIDLEKQVWLTTYPNAEYYVTKEDILARFDNHASRVQVVMADLNNQNHRYFLIQIGSKHVGYMHLERQIEHNHIVELYILTEFQGIGIGSSAVEYAFTWFGDRKPIFLQVVSYNQSAIDFYEKFGFLIDPSIHRDPNDRWNLLPSGKYIPVVSMVKHFV